MRTGIIYRYLNIESGKSYVGQTINPERRFKSHLTRKYEKGWHVDYQKHPDKYEYIVVEDNIPEEQLDEREVYWIDYYDSYNNGYNLTEGGGGSRGYKVSYETRQKLSEKGKCRKVSYETRQKLHNANKGQIPWIKNNHHSEETKKKISDANKGKIFSEEHKRKLSVSKKGKYCGENNSFYGKHHSEETKKKISDAKKGHTPWNKGKTGLHWYNNGVISIQAHECPEGFISGRIKNKKNKDNNI